MRDTTNTKTYNVMRAIFGAPFRWLFRVRVLNPEKFPETGGCILCANHTSMADAIVLSAFCHRQIRYMAKKELFKVPVLGWLLTIIGAYPVDRGGADIKSIRRTISLIEDGSMICIFPEGTRHGGEDPSQTPIKHGVGMIAWHAKADIVPVYIRTKGNRVRPFRKTELIIGDKIPFSDLGFDGGGTAQYKYASEKIFGTICALGGYTRTLPAPPTRKPAGAETDDTEAQA